MTKAELIVWAVSENLEVSDVVERTQREIYNHRTNWSAVEVKKTEGESVTEYTPCGYRKHTTDEYVPNAYRRNFGWKNTYYQRAILRVSFGPLYARG